MVQGTVSIKSMPEDHGIICTFLGYTKNHTDSTYHILDIITKCLVLSRSVIWTNKKYDEYIPRK